MNKNYKIIVILLVAFILGGVLGYAIRFNYEKEIIVENLSSIRPIRDYNSGYKFINPLLAYVIPSADQQGVYSDLRNSIANFINTKKKNNDLLDVSVYFKDMDRGKWVGINEKQKYHPASMLKVVVMVTYLKDAQKDANLLGKKLMYTNEIDSSIRKDIYDADSSLQVNQWYTVDNLIKKMIINSDNGAKTLLLMNINNTSLDYIYNVLDIPNPETTDEDFTISPRMYSLFFRILYNSTYLSEDMSEKALGILHKATFVDGIVAGLPKDIVVAHKFGEYVSSNNNQIKNIELHDCGIVYYLTKPYFICVMTRGNNLDELKSVIKNISSIVYQYYSTVD